MHGRGSNPTHWIRLTARRKMNISENIKKAAVEDARQYGEDTILYDLTAEGGDCPDIAGGQWLSDEEISRMTELGWPVAEKNGKTLFLSMSHALILGATGRGKTTVGYQNIARVFARMKKPPSLFITDAKGDGVPVFIPLLEATHDIYVVNCMNPSLSLTFNSLLDIYDAYHEAHRIKLALQDDTIDLVFDGKTYPTKAMARAMANAKRNTILDLMDENISTTVNIIVKTTDPKSMSWDNGARSMLRAIILAALFYSEDERYGITRENFHIGTIAQIARSVQDDCEYLISFLHHVHNPEIEQTIHATYQLQAKQTRDSYVSSLNNALSRYVSRIIQVLSHSSSLDLNQIVCSSRPVAIFVISDDSRQNTVAFAAMLFQTFVQKLKNTAARSPNHCLDRDFVFLLDEVCNCSSMLSDQISGMISTLRCYKIWLSLGVQTLDQLKALYGDNTAKTIVDNCGLKLFFGSNNMDCKEYFSREMGKRQVSCKTFNTTADTASRSISSATVPLLPVSQLEQLEIGEFFVIHERLKNIRLKARMLPLFARTDVAHTEADMTAYGVLEQDMFDPEHNLIDVEKIVERWEDDHCKCSGLSMRGRDYYKSLFAGMDSLCGDESGEMEETEEDLETSEGESPGDRFDDPVGKCGK